MYYTYSKISKQVYDYCITNKLVDAALIAKWKKPGYERLCSTYVINPRNYKFGTVSVCRVPKQFLAPGTEIEDPVTGCRGCASGSNHNIFDNKYGQYLAAIQVAREERQARKAAMRAQAEREAEEAEAEQEAQEAEQANHRSGRKGDGANFWASSEQEQNIELTSDMIGQLSGEARSEAMTAAAKARAGGGEGPRDEYDGPAGKKARNF